MSLQALSPVTAKNPLSPTITWRRFSGINGHVWVTERRNAKPLGLAVVCASGKKKNNDPASSGNGDTSLPGGDNKESSKSKPLNENSNSNSNSKDSKLHNAPSDWRDFRASLVAREKNILLDKGPIESPQTGELGQNWAHPIQYPEPGCLLLATQAIDHIAGFSRTVVLLLTLDESPIGIILNRPLDTKVRNLPLSNPNFTSNFANHPLHLGGPLGPLDISMFLVKTEDAATGVAYQSGLAKVVNGVHYGGRDKILHADALVKGGVIPESHFKFFAGYASWTKDQLLDEIERGFWVVTAGSSKLIASAVSEASDCLWQEVLGMMGGEYEELSKKPKIDEV